MAFSVLLALFPHGAHGQGEREEVPAFRGMPEGARAGAKPDVALAGGGWNLPGNRNGERNASEGSSAPADRTLPFATHDLDEDGFVSLAEAAGHERLVKGFRRADRNRDGRLSKKEYARLERKKPAKKTRAK